MRPISAPEGLLWRVIDPVTSRLLFPGGFRTENAAHLFGISGVIRRDWGDYKVVRF